MLKLLLVLGIVSGCSYNVPICTDMTIVRFVMGPSTQQRTQCHSFDLQPSPDIDESTEKSEESNNRRTESL